MAETVRGVRRMDLGDFLKASFGGFFLPRLFNRFSARILRICGLGSPCVCTYVSRVPDGLKITKQENSYLHIHLVSRYKLVCEIPPPLAYTHLRKQGKIGLKGSMD